MIDFGIICDSGLETLYYLTEEMTCIPQLTYPCTLPYKQLLANGCEDIYSKMLPYIVQTHFFEAVQRKSERHLSPEDIEKGPLCKIRLVFQMTLPFFRYDL